MARRRTKLEIEVEYDDRITDPETLAGLADTLLDTILGDPDIAASLVEEYGGVQFGEFFVHARKRRK